MFFEDRTMEVLLIGALALIVIGPKDLPIAMRRLGQFIGKMRGMANEFRASFDELARQSELDALRREVEALRTGHPLGDPRLDQTISDIHHGLGHGPQGPVMTAAPVFLTAGETLVEAPPMIAEAESVPAVAETETEFPASPKPARKPRAKAPAKAAGPKAASPKAASSNT